MSDRQGRPLDWLPFPPFAIPLVVSCTLWARNFARIPFEEALPTIASSLVLTAVLVALIRTCSGSWRRASLIGAIWAAYVLYSPTLARWFDVPWLQGFVLAALALLAWDLSRNVPREWVSLNKTHRLANVVLSTFALAFAGAIFVAQVRLERVRPDVNESFHAFRGRADRGSPDVWHIIMDRYASEETLDRVYGLDNRPFLNALRTRGFAINDAAFANYQRTAHSVASTLNGNYLDRLALRVGSQNDAVPIYRSLTDNAALRFFKTQGYQTIFAGSWWNPTRHSDFADRNVNYRAMPQLARMLWEKSIFGWTAARFHLPFGDGRVEQCHRIKIKFAELRRIAAEPGRKYVFAHFLLPHPPFVINADGACRSLEQAVHATREENYRGQVVYANRELLRLIDAIFAGPRPATIILHADEGPWPKPYVGDERFIGRDPVSVDWPRISNDDLHEKMGILMAIRHSDGLPAVPPRTPINIYPILINRSFTGTMPIREERNFLYRSDRTLYSFVDVSERLR